MWRRVKWSPVAAVAISAAAVIAGAFGIDPAVTVPTGLLGVTLGLVAHDNS